MAWSQVALCAPQSLRGIKAAMQPGLETAAAEINASRSRLSTVNGLATINTNPASAESEGVTNLREALDGLLLAGGRFACVHPYVHPIGDRRGDYAYLTPQQAVAAMAAKFADPRDLPDDSETHAVFLLLRAVDHAGFASTLQAVNTILPVSPLQMAQRRAGWLSSLETDKFIQPTGPDRPVWIGTSAIRNDALSDAGCAIGALAAVNEAFAMEATRPDVELAALISKKEARIEALAEAWETISGLFIGGAGRCLALSGGHAAIRRQLLDEAPPVEGYALAALCAWIGTNEQTTLIREAMGL